ncbi:MAG: hypothetical protein ABSA79_07960 [Candidatus Bathyarchaeia archaeon]|jgi:hypothetical protein
MRDFQVFDVRRRMFFGSKGIGMEIRDSVFLFRIIHISALIFPNYEIWFSFSIYYFHELADEKKHEDGTVGEGNRT